MERAQSSSTWQQWMAVFVVCAAFFLDTLNVTIINAALPIIQRDLGLTEAALQWVPNAYTLMYAGFLLLGGRVADMLGRRRVFMAGVTVLGLASLVGGLVTDSSLLIAARAVQGLGAAFTVPATVAIITTIFPEGPRRNTALGAFGATGAWGLSLGLVLGGVLTDLIDWHWIFLANVPLVILVLLLARSVVPESRAHLDHQSYDIGGAATVTGGLVLLVYAIAQANAPGTPLLQTVVLVLLALALLAAFVAIERRVASPLLPLRIFRLPTVRIANLASLTLLGPFFSFLFIAQLYMQGVGKYSALQGSLALLPGTLLSAVVAQVITPRLVTRLGVWRTALIGLLSFAVGLALFIRIDVVADYLGVILPASLVGLGIGTGIAYPALTIAAVSGVTAEEAGLAAGLQSTALQTGGGLGLAIIVALVTVRTAALLGTGSPGAGGVEAQVGGYQLGLLAAAIWLVVGALIVLFGVRRRSIVVADQPAASPAG